MRAGARILVVCHCQREFGSVIRIISARRAGRHEQSDYWSRLKRLRKEYDFSKARRNPYARRLKKQITIRLDEPTIAYCKAVSESNGIPYQTLINLYLRDCAMNKRRLTMEWQASA
jgi:predicted DNA binding CopG/RHH family protein